uniref:Thyroid receptor interacting protein 11 n=1 Tax=Echinococcus granulosus TaxID=6210 RepID=A0A068WEL0_ECHGR|nr:thyroid receptor interacting protein 11 [Echinococcus granulosus]
MAWLESLKSSSAARLVSSAAREIFSESTPETEDPIADLRNSRSRIAELECLVGDYKSEIQSYRDEISKLNLRIESLELQVIRSQKESDACLRGKEAQIQELIAEINLRRGEPEGECVPQRGSKSVSADRSGRALLATGESFLRSDDVVVQHSEKPEVILLSELSNKCEEVEFAFYNVVFLSNPSHSMPYLFDYKGNANRASYGMHIIPLYFLFYGYVVSDVNNFSHFSIESPSSIDTAVQMDTPPIEVLHDIGEAVDRVVNTAVLGGNNGVSDVDTDIDNVESVESRFFRIREALASAVSLLPPLASDRAAVVWPPRQPEAQVAVLVAAEAASRQELMKARAYIGQLQRPPPSSLPNTMELHSQKVSTDSFSSVLDRSAGSVPTDIIHQQQPLTRLVHVCELLETTLISCAKLLRGECCLADFDEVVSPLMQVEKRYADMVEALKSAFASTPLECSLKEICSQLETYGKVTATSDVSNPTALRLYELLSKRRDPLRDFLLNGKGKVNEEDQKIVDKFNYLVKKSEYKDALSDAILCLLDDIETGSERFDSNAYDLDVDSLNIVKRLTAALFTKITTICSNQTEKEAIEGIRNRIKSIDKNDLIPELKSALCCLDSLFNVIDDSKTDSTENSSTQAIRRKISNYTVANNLLKLLALQKFSEGNELSTTLKIVKLMLHEGKSDSASEKINWTASGLSEEAIAIINCFNQLAKVGAEHELRDYVIELVNFGTSNLKTLGPQNQIIAKGLTDMLNHVHQSDSNAVDLLGEVAEGIRNNAFDGLDERIKSTEGDERLLSHLGSLLESFANLRAKYVQAEKDKAALIQLVRSKHAESQAYHTKLKEVLNERQSVHTNQGEDVAKLTAKIERLELHLVQMEESHTREAVAAEEREASLRETLGQTEAQLAALQEFVASADEQIGCAIEERNVAREVCRTCQAELSALQLNYMNLQKVLDGLEREKQTERNATAQHFRLENERLRQEMGSLQQCVKNLQAEVTRLGNLESINHALQEQLERHAGRLSEAHSLARRYEERIQVLKSEMKDMADELNGKLDKSVMKSLLISCMKLPPAKRPEAFRSLGSVLNFTSDDYDLLGFNEPIARNWRDLFWKSDTPTTQNSPKPEHSFVELLANFLEKESSPPSQIRLPTDYLRYSSTSADTDRNLSQGFQRRRNNSTSTIQQRLSPTSPTPSERVASPREPNASKNPLLSGLSVVKPSSAMD